MSRIAHPVAGLDLLHSPELELRHPAERPDTERVYLYDEGAGCGFDRVSPDALAERWVEVADGAVAVMTWFSQRFVARRRPFRAPRSSAARSATSGPAGTISAMSAEKEAAYDLLVTAPQPRAAENLSVVDRR